MISIRYMLKKNGKKREEAENRQVCKMLLIFLCNSLPPMVKKYIEGMLGSEDRPSLTDLKKEGETAWE